MESICADRCVVRSGLGDTFFHLRAPRQVQPATRTQARPPHSGTGKTRPLVTCGHGAGDLTVAFPKSFRKEGSLHTSGSSEPLTPGPDNSGDTDQALMTGNLARGRD
ncbi:hypothetical protein GW7_10541 [Heterocephalus glaber]|uniref:Uncharacterized protein n=1 Tax=Heterocephalus glaber TaxID=10181 RepID=G5AJY2_HETGA|nr:hypothetical protein GW7_10541 [Heterocephalus glaber]